MISLYPTLYDEFTCKADQCKKTCCQRWEIDIDARSARRYLQEEGALGQELRQWIIYTQEGHRFRFEPSGYCHFLQDGLCRLVLAKGEDYLCDICHAHPRFYTYVGDLELCGVGLACEASVALLLASTRLLFDTKKGAGSPVDWLDGNLYFREDLDEETQALLVADGLDAEPRMAVTLGEILADLGLPVAEEELDFVSSLTRLSEEDFGKSVLAVMGETDPIDEAWTEHLSELGKNRSSLEHALREHLRYNDRRRNHLNRFYQYCIYRQLDKLTSIPWKALVQYGVLNTFFVGLLAQLYGSLEKALADWSEQIEYDTDNVALIFDRLT